MLAARKGNIMRKFTVVIIAVLLATGVIAACGCGGGSGDEEDITLYTGKYWSESNPSDYIEIMPNNTFVMMEDNEETSGSCSVEEGTLSLSAGSYNETMKINAGVITAGGKKYAIVTEEEDEESEQSDSAAIKKAIEGYCQEKGIEMASLTVSEEKSVSTEDPDWEIDYAFPAEAEGTGQFFLLHKTGTDWAVIAHTEGAQTGWTAVQLEGFGAPRDLATD